MYYAALYIALVMLIAVGAGWLHAAWERRNANRHQ
jgi:hypothetical protein